MNLEWFSTVEDKQPAYYLAINFTPADPTANPQLAGYSPTAFLKLPLNDDGTSIKPDLGSGVILAFIDNLARIGGGLVTSPIRNESGIMRDPAGRLKSYSADLSGKLFSHYFNSARPPGIDTAFGGVDMDRGITINDGSIPPSGVFVIYEQGVTRTTIQKPGKNGDIVDIPAEDYPVLEFSVYGDQRCQVNYYGNVRVARDTKYLVQSPEPTYIIGGIIDSPPPCPVVNYKGQELAGDRAETGTLTYGKENEIEHEISSESKWSVGFETSGEFSKGIGPAWDISFEGGMGSVAKETSGTTLRRTIGAAGGVISKSPYDRPEADASGAVQVMAAAFHFTAYQFLDAQGNMITDGLGKAESSATPKVGSLLATMINGEPLASSFEPYCVVPGDLVSFTPEAINAKMTELGYKDTDNYFGNIICANAFVWHDGQDSYPYREFTWTNGNAATSPAAVFKSSYKEQSWSFDGSIYAGISGGFDVLDVEEFEAKFMVGTKFSKDRSESDSSTSNGPK